ncbi:ribonuclease H-like domain-containing protein [Tahibacter harae]|uniref:Ribonuclease H-like domain-containing protein n=1 Tax=Tahibacter harae TaxID=2963937 RepID=A0ABT1QWJ8_9GAMM|nr:ribonuclease H-like domain-containing protein [Tahibacter harae]MCQ4166653.1 ribonuclease H-like domain-containing protein [Tahibacter harae]
MSALLEKLQRLRRQAGAVSAAGSRSAATAAQTPANAAVESLAGEGAEAVPRVAAESSSAASPLSPAKPAPGLPARSGAPVAAELQRLRRLLDLRPASELPPPRRAPSAAPLRGEEIAPGLYFVEQHFPDPGPAALLPPRWPQAEPVPCERFLCFDSETTGLAGGSGTRAFMLGAADWREGGLRVRQLYLSALSGEAAMLAEFARWIQPDSVLVSYNGRSYDAPLLAARYRLQRLPDPIKPCAHVDLLHPVRRAYRGRWENCRLATIERRLLQIVREDDLPGSEAPAAWRSWLRQGFSTNLLRVLEHNRQDVITLARLLRHMDQAASPDGWMQG